MDKIDYSLMEALHKKMPQEMIYALRVMEKQRQEHPNDPQYDLNDFQQERTENLLTCFQLAVEDKYAEGAFVLFTSARAEYMLKNLNARLYSDISPVQLQWFTKFAKVFEYNLNGVAQLFDEIVFANNSVVDNNAIESIGARIRTAIQMVDPYEQKQRVLRVLEKREHTQHVQTKKM